MESEASRGKETDPVPVSIERDADAILIRWSDEAVTRRTASQLRDACPCATCREKKRGQTDQATDDENQSEASSSSVDQESPIRPASKSISLPILSKAEARPLRVEKMNPVGSYAYQITFSDGHSSGIFPFHTLRDP